MTQITIRELDRLLFRPASSDGTLTKTEESTIEMRKLLVNIGDRLPNVAAAGPDLAALRVLLNLQLDAASAHLNSTLNQASD
jgi:hypothetical protein